MARLAGQHGIYGLKEATGDLQRLHDLRELCPASLALYSGDDASACDFMLQGGQGVISVTANVAARDMALMCLAALAGEREQAQALNLKLMPLHQALFVESNPIPVKWACARLGLVASSGLRLPLTDLSADGQVWVARALDQAELMRRA